MLTPLLSVTAIGLLVALAALTARHPVHGPALPLGIAGAWGGFLAGAVPGAVFDVIAGTGWMLALSGHVAAFAMATTLIFTRPKTADSPVLPGQRAAG